MPHTDIAIVGAGILGLAHAYAAAKAGRSVTVFEKSPKSSGASVRNFGMVWPVGQPHGEMLDLSLRSRELWTELLTAANLPFKNTGSLHLAYADDEAAVIQEFATVAPAMGYSCNWLDGTQVLAKSDAVVEHGALGSLRGGLWSDTELTVDPRQIIASLPAFLAEKYGVKFHFATQVRSVEPTSTGNVVSTTNGLELTHAETVFVCSGEDFETLYPEHFAASGLTRCKLQMMRTATQPAGWQLGPSLAAGLTLRFYPAFQVCKSLPALAHRIATETPEFDRWFIHALVSQTADGALTLGDSHEYGLAVDIFNKQEVDDLILDYTLGFLRAPDLRVAERWYGVYAKHPTKPLVTMSPSERVRIVASPGGSGMTLSMGVGERSLIEMGLL